MICQKCKAELKDGSGFCSQCGTTVPASQPSAGTGELIGFSQKISDPAFESYRKKSIAWSIIFSLILFIIAVFGFPIYGKASGEIDWPNSLFYGLGIGGMFIVIALLQTAKRTLDKTWDGEVVFKDSYTIKERSQKGPVHYHRVYVLKIKKDTGGTKKHKWRDIPGVYNYYSLGDRVRHHRGFQYYEKYDKSKDSQIMCAACMSFQDIDKDVCPRCKCPLLK